MSAIALVEYEEAGVLVPASTEVTLEPDNAESIKYLHPELQREDRKLQYKRNRTARKKRNIRFKDYKRKSRTADSYLSTENRQALAKVLQDKARAHKINFLRLSAICDANPYIPGVINQVQNAATLLSHNQSIAELLPEAVAAGESQLDMENAMRALEAELDEHGEGVPVTCSLELTRRIFDEGLSGSKEIVQIEYSGRNEKYQDEEEC